MLGKSTLKKLKQLDKEAEEARRNRFYDKDKNKAALEKTMCDIVDIVKKEGIDG